MPYVWAPQRQTGTPSQAMVAAKQLPEPPGRAHLVPSPMVGERGSQRESGSKPICRGLSLRKTILSVSKGACSTTACNTRDGNDLNVQQQRQRLLEHK